MSKLIQMKNDSGENLFPISIVNSNTGSSGDFIEQGTWTPKLENCTYTPYAYRTGKYVRIGKMVIVTFHERPYITAVSSVGNAYISGLPYKPAWPQQGSGALGTCMVTNTSYMPTIGVSNDDNGYITLNDNTSGAGVVKWKTTGNSGGYWLDGFAIYSIN